MKTASLIRIFHHTHLVRDSLLFSVFGFSMQCRFPTSCSQYTIAQIEKHGTITGLKKGLERVVRCHSFSKPILSDFN